MANYWSAEDAALALSKSLKRIAELEASKSQYDYSYPPSLGDDMSREGGTVRDAVRYLMSTEAD